MSTHDVGSNKRYNEMPARPVRFDASESSYTPHNLYIVNEDTALAVSVSIYERFIFLLRPACSVSDAILRGGLYIIITALIKPHMVWRAAHAASD